MKVSPILMSCLFLSVSALFAQPAVNGTIDILAENYLLIGSTAEYYPASSEVEGQLGNGEPDKGTIYFAQDAENIYIFVTAQLSDKPEYALGLWLNFTNLTGAPAGTPLGGYARAHYMDGNGDVYMNFKADFEVDYMFSYYNSHNAWIYGNASKLVSPAGNSYLGSCNLTGGTETGHAGPGAFTNEQISFAFNNSGGEAHGLEMRISKSAIGYPEATDDLQVFVFLADMDGYFSNICAPGYAGAEDPGYNANFRDSLAGEFFTSLGVIPLPVELTSFTGRVDKGEVMLNWQTATEAGNYGFEVERSSGGEKDWKKLCFIAGSGFSNSAKTYSYTDKQITLPGKYSYRLKQLDNSGHYEYSETVEVSLSSHAEFVLLQNCPNPFNPATVISYSLPEDGFVTLKVFDLLGQEVRTLENGYVKAGSHSVYFNAEGLSSGVYLCSLRSEGGMSAVKKMLLAK